MWWFDARQQFGVVGLFLAGDWRRPPMDDRRVPGPRSSRSATPINTAFAFTYNVGDTHVFYLPSHLFTALLAGALRFASVCRGSKADRPALQIALVALVDLIRRLAWRGTRGPRSIATTTAARKRSSTRLALGVNPQTRVLVTNLNWQLENALLYYSRWQRRDIRGCGCPDVEPHFPFLVRDNEAISRDIVMDSYAAREVVAAFGPLVPHSTGSDLHLSGSARRNRSRLPPGTPCVLCILTPPREEHLDAGTLRLALEMLTRGHIPSCVHWPVSTDGRSRRRSSCHHPVGGVSIPPEFRLLDEPFSVRMESWLPSDTFRRAGFGPRASWP